MISSLLHLPVRSLSTCLTHFILIFVPAKASEDLKRE